jgi:3-oxoacyl-[acyl-carrier-protein] synthase-3
VVLSATEDEDRGVLAVAMHADGSLGDLIERPGGGSRNPPSQHTLDEGLNFLRMRGNETFKVAVRSLAEVSEEVLEECGCGPQDVDWFIPHQANRRIIDAVGERLAIREGHTYVNIERYGNTSAASIPIALDELHREGKIDPGHLVLLSAFGSGLTWAAAAIRW